MSPTRGWSQTPVKSGLPFARRGTGFPAPDCAAIDIATPERMTMPASNRTKFFFMSAPYFLLVGAGSSAEAVKTDRPSGNVTVPPDPLGDPSFARKPSNFLVIAKSPFGSYRLLVKPIV